MIIEIELDVADPAGLLSTIEKLSGMFTKPELVKRLNTDEVEKEILIIALYESIHEADRLRKRLEKK